MRIIGPPCTPLDRVTAGLASAGATTLFLDDILPAVWAAGTRYGIDPAGLAAQAAKETGYGAFGGAVTADFRNPAGLKVRALGRAPFPAGDEPLAHASFPTWRTGALAQAQHVCAYAGLPLPDGEILVDPRWDWVAGKYALENWAQLGTRWAPSPTYGIEIEQMLSTWQKAR